MAQMNHETSQGIQVPLPASVEVEVGEEDLALVEEAQRASGALQADEQEADEAGDEAMLADAVSEATPATTSRVAGEESLILKKEMQGIHNMIFGEDNRDILKTIRALNESYIHST